MEDIVRQIVIWLEYRRRKKIIGIIDDKSLKVEKNNAIIMIIMTLENNHFYKFLI